MAVTSSICLSLGLFGLTEWLTGFYWSPENHGTGLLPNSALILPLEDLDELSPKSVAAQSATDALNAALLKSKAVQLQSNALVREIADPLSAEQWRRIGENANAALIMSGSVRKRGGKSRIGLHLVESATGSILHTWLADGDSHSDIAQSLARDVSEYLNDNDKKSPTDVGETKIPAARSYYDRGKEFFFRYNLADQERAIESFRKAIEIDPNYAQAHAMLATTCQLHSSTDPNGGWLQEAEVAAANALRIAPMLPEAHGAKGGIFRARGLYREAFDPFLTAYELDPSSSRAAAKIGSICDVVGRPDLPCCGFEKAIHRETRPVYDDNIASVWAVLGDYERAEKAYQTSAESSVRILPVGALGLSMLSLFRGDFEGARHQCNVAREKYRDHPHPLMMAALIEFFSRRYSEAEKLYRKALESNHAGGVEFVGSVRFLSALGFVLRESGDEREGKRLLEEALLLDEQELSTTPENPERLYSLAANQAALGYTSKGVNGQSNQRWVD